MWVQPLYIWKSRSVLYEFFCVFFILVSQCNISLKKQRSRSIFSTLFCCFRDYNVEPPSTNSTSALPPLVEENGGLQKVRLFSYSTFQRSLVTEIERSTSKCLSQQVCLMGNVLYQLIGNFWWYPFSLKLTFLWIYDMKITFKTHSKNVGFP